MLVYIGTIEIWYAFFIKLYIEVLYMHKNV
jgi:hypothetical protein